MKKSTSVLCNVLCHYLIFHYIWFTWRRVQVWSGTYWFAIQRLCEVRTVVSLCMSFQIILKTLMVSGDLVWSSALEDTGFLGAGSDTSDMPIQAQKVMIHDKWIMQAKMVWQSHFTSQEIRLTSIAVFTRSQCSTWWVMLKHVTS